MRKKLKWRKNKAVSGEEERNLVGQLAIFKYIFSLIPSEIRKESIRYIVNSVDKGRLSQSTFLSITRIYFFINKKPRLLGRVFEKLQNKLFRMDCFYGANIGAGTAVGTYIGVYFVNIAFRNSFNRTFVNACSASCAIIGYFVSHIN
jgi:hypothetical protein